MRCTGRSTPGRGPRTTRCCRTRPYSAAKAGGDLLARSYAVTYGLDVRVTRCSNNYGPYHFPEKVIPLFITNLLDGLPVPLYGEGANIRDWLFVGDHCRALALVLERGSAGEIYNIGGGRELSNRELTEHLLAATGRDWSFVTPIVDPRGAGHDLRYSVDFSQDRRPRLPPADLLRGRAGPDRRMVPRESRLVGTAARASIVLMRWLITGARGQLGTPPGHPARRRRTQRRGDRAGPRRPRHHRCRRGARRGTGGRPRRRHQRGRLHRGRRRRDRRGNGLPRQRHAPSNISAGPRRRWARA